VTRPSLTGLAVAAGLAATVVGGCGLLPGAGTSSPAVRVDASGDPERGRQAILRYGCGACHTIPGVSGARGRIGPLLAGVGERAFLAGTVRNTPQNLARWVEDPPALKPDTGMPNLGVSTADAQDIAAYLSTLR